MPQISLSYTVLKDIYRFLESVNISNIKQRNLNHKIAFNKHCLRKLSNKV